MALEKAPRRDLAESSAQWYDKGKVITWLREHNHDTAGVRTGGGLVCQIQARTRPAPPSRPRPNCWSHPLDSLTAITEQARALLAEPRYGTYPSCRPAADLVGPPCRRTATPATTGSMPRPANRPSPRWRQPEMKPIPQHPSLNEPGFVAVEVTAADEQMAAAVAQAAMCWFGVGGWV
ncbi:DUF6207 family protein [Streptomyces sp. NPDC017056]|uniref:DUF6207 family protein n=1 Tax=Streptomyces sp. NPDC017056 TaxID=3364973 RepID=UPI00378D42F0